MGLFYNAPEPTRGPQVAAETIWFVVNALHTAVHNVDSIAQNSCTPGTKSAVHDWFGVNHTVGMEASVVWRKVMAAYRRVYDSREPRSAPESYARQRRRQDFVTGGGELRYGSIGV